MQTLNISDLWLKSSYLSMIMMSFFVIICQICKYVHRMVCRSVRMNVVDMIQVAPFDQSSPSFTHICTLARARHWIFCKIKGQITRSRGKKCVPNFESVITPSIIKLERRSKAQNVGHWTGYWNSILNLRWHFRWKSSLHLKISSVLKFRPFQYSLNLTSDI